MNSGGIIGLIIVILVVFIAITLAIIFINKSPSQLGQTCTSQANCSPNLVCDFQRAVHVCVNGLNSPCTKDTDCQTGLACTSGTCQPVVPLPLTPVTVPNIPDVSKIIRREQPVAIPPPPKIVKPILTQVVQPEKQIPEFDNESISSPFLEFDDHREGKPYVVDITTYSTALIVLLHDGSLIRDNNDVKVKISSNLRMERLEVFGGYIYGISEGILYKLSSDIFKDTKYIWSPIKAAPTGITHISATLDGKRLWLQAKGKGYIYNSSFENLSTVDYPSGRRIYGTDASTYIDIKDDHGITSKGESFANITGAVIDYYGHVTTLSREQAQIYSDIRLINWMPYYIRYAS